MNRKKFQRSTIVSSTTSISTVGRSVGWRKTKRCKTRWKPTRQSSKPRSATPALPTSWHYKAKLRELYDKFKPWIELAKPEQEVALSTGPAQFSLFAPESG